MTPASSLASSVSSMPASPCGALRAANGGSSLGAPSRAPTAMRAVPATGSNQAAQLASANSPVLRQNL
ncbi:hypothetical protein G6F31_021232 [Rhizopus arrhizus]|nr:hypothetical protein G6F31_021232 [Rhizopus arrhizus]